MKFEERVRKTIKTNGTNIFMDVLCTTDPDAMKYHAWLLTFGLLDTYITLKQVDLNDDTY